MVNGQSNVGRVQARVAPVLVAWWFLAGCGGAQPNEPVAVSPEEATTTTPGAVVAAPDIGALRVGDLQLAESWPVETTLDNPDIVDAQPLWLEMIDSAERSLDFSHFYAVSAPGATLEAVIAAVEAAASRGVKVRFMVDKKFYRDEHIAVPERLAAHPGIEVRVFDLGSFMGGVQHAKYFIVDDREAFFGSQNFDWRSLMHIVELGARLEPQGLVRPLVETFAHDWALAGGETQPEPKPRTCALESVSYGDAAVRVQTVLSPREWIPQECDWDLPHILRIINGAERNVYVQLLNYSTQMYDRSTWMELDDALQAAAARGVDVRLMVADWSTRKKYIGDLQRLVQVPNVSVRMVTIPEASTGPIPFARVIHTKLLVADGAWSWLGTSNWSGDYFLQSRNVGVVAEGAALAQDLEGYFLHIWDSAYAWDVDPEAVYE